ncbi:GntP family permease [Blastococcus sp. VKM Ac-2987]|uniref:GntP family permease n=1 Tax=Blastococcus sp. VKM Ac-2987 TaxID=3004141 RepID=UPI0022AB61DE|nr:GntP family permease [Blastococcus sp. VKM Ac-2987]MCZ2860012.1 GntP family permease [Blastococcus sp. VKM Ac-2987]
MIILHASIAILGVLLLIIVLKVEPVIALVLGSLYLGIAGGIGLAETVEVIAVGFGEIMAEVGLLIGFGVLLGALLFALGALQKFVALLLRLLGAKRLPYAMSAALTTLFPSIYVDVQLVLASPLARSAAPHIGRGGLPLLAGSLTAGILVGYVFVVPGLGTLSIAGLLDIPLGTMLIFGLVVGPATAVVTTFLFSLVLKAGFWNAASDEHETQALRDAEHAADQRDGEHEAAMPPLTISLLPVLVPLLLIASGAIASAAGVENPVIAFVSNPVFALFLGMVGAYALTRRTLGRERTDDAVTTGLSTTGQILLITGIGGSLGAVIGETTLDQVLGDLFSASTGASVILTLLLAWLIAALLHFAIGSISVAAIAAAGILAPVLGSLDVAPVVVGLAIGAGALFALQVNSNFFWMFQSLLGISTQGALKALTFVTALASVVAMPIIIVLGFLVPA